MVRSSGFGSTTCYYFAHFRLAFASAPVLNTLTSQHIVTRRPVLQKVRSHACPKGVALLLLVSIRFQVLFHSPPGVLFTFPSRYYTLSVIRSYLALGDGPPSFPPNFSCSMVLWILTSFSSVSITGLLPYSAVFSNTLHLLLKIHVVSPNPLLISK